MPAKRYRRSTSLTIVLHSLFNTKDNLRCPLNPTGVRLRSRIGAHNRIQRSTSLTYVLRLLFDAKKTPAVIAGVFFILLMSTVERQKN